jgi:hypothetical protein
MDPGEQTTGTRDENYNLVSVLYHALQGAETIEAYILDAETTGDERLADFFREAQGTYRRLAERAKGKLGILEVPPEPEVAPDVPLEGGISPGAMSGGIPPLSADVQREPDVRPDIPTEEVPPPTDVPRTPPDTPVFRDEDIVAESGGAPQRGISMEAPPAKLTEDAEAPGELGGRPEQQRAEQPEEEQKEKKGLIDRIADKAAEKLTGQ